MLSFTVCRLLMKIYTPIKYKQEQFTRWVLSWVPTYIHQVFYIPEKSSYVTQIFKHNSYQSWSNHTVTELNQGYYLFVYWNNRTYQMERILMHSDHILKALKLTDLQNVLAFSDHCLIDLMIQYLKNNSYQSIIDLFLDTENVFSKLHKYIPSFELQKNATARLVYLIDQCEKNHIIDLKQEDFKVVFYTDTLDEIIVNKDEFLYS